MIPASALCAAIETLRGSQLRGLDSPNFILLNSKIYCAPTNRRGRHAIT